MAKAALAPEAYVGKVAPSRVKIRAFKHGWERLTPARQFHVLAAVACLVGALVISLTVSYLIEDYIFGETRDLTVAGVDLHFRAAFGDDIFVKSLSPEEFKRFDQMVHSHFDLYNIVQVKFYRTDGYITYSYTPNLINSVSPEGRMSDKLRRALGGEIVMNREELSPTDNDRGREFPHVFELYIPIRNNGHVVGVAEVYRDVERILVNVRYIQGLVTSTVVVAVLIMFLLLRQIYANSTRRIAAQSTALQNALSQIEATYDETLETLSIALDARDSETEGHSRRVREFAVALAQQMGVSRAELENIARGALLHDAGKLNVPDSVLLKPGPLTPSEWTQMRQHPELGYRMLVHIGFLREALPIVRHHHERFDGDGYPLGLKGDQIPFGARIFAVADALDAMTSDRPYRTARPFDEAWQEILRQSGKQFDPQVVEAFATFPTGDWTRMAGEVASKRGSLWGILQADKT